MSEKQISSQAGIFAPGREFFVAPGGDDAGAGTRKAPFASLEGARNAIRRMKAAGGLPVGGVVVTACAGVYELEQSLCLGAEDSGTPDAPITYRAAPGESVLLTGGRRIDAFVPVADKAILQRLSPETHGKVYQADLKAMGIADYGDYTEPTWNSTTGTRLELFFNDRPMTVARWPNEGFVPIVDVVAETPVDVRGTKGDRSGKIIYDGDRPRRWVDETQVRLHGYWFWDWADQRMDVASIDLANKVIALKNPENHTYGYRRGQWYYAEDALCELDAPGEWYLDRRTGMLYFYPPSPLDGGEVVISMATSPLMALSGASHIALKGLTFAFGRTDGVAVSEGNGVRIVGCTFRNLGVSAVRVEGGADHGVIGCDIFDVGAGGIAMRGGDRSTLTPAGHFAVNNHIHHYARWERIYRPGIRMDGVGHRIAHNLIHDAPHMAIGFSGNDHVIEFNEIHNVVYESNDAGAIYAGRDWTMRGHVIRFNYIHHVTGFKNRGCVGVYLDDMFASAEIFGNVFYKVSRAAFIGGGRDCAIVNNIFVDCAPAVHIDARALGWAKYHADEWLAEAAEKGTLSGIAFDKPPYNTRYPDLADILRREPRAPEGNVVARNISWGGAWDGMRQEARPYLRIDDNLVDEDPHFVDPDRCDFQLRDDSPAFKLGFERIPIRRIGLMDDQTRASWPVQHAVAPGEQE